MAPSSSLLLGLKLSMGFLAAAWVSFWILKPTKTWKRSWHLAEELANDTFLRDCGLNVVVFCLPVMGLAILAFIHMHFHQERKQRKQTRSWDAAFSRPIIVKSLIGVISLGELLAVSLFLCFVSWTYYSDVSSDFKKLVPYASLNLNRWQLKVMNLGIRAGTVSEVCLAVMLFPILRGMSFLRIFGIQFEAAVRYHTWIAHAFLWLCTLHGVIIMFIWGQKKVLLKEITTWQRVGRVNLAGAIGLIAGLAIWITSLPVIRRKYFQLFYITHHTYIVFIGFFLLHAGEKHFYLVFSGVFLFSLDKVLCFIQSRREVCIVYARVLPCKAVELILPKEPSMKYKPMSTIYLKVPSISKFQWHPFSITSSCYQDENNVSLLIKCQGKWTEALYSKISSIKDEKLDQLKSLIVAFEGPHGPSSSLYERYSNLVLIAGGSGITPFMSLLNEISSRSSSTRSYPRKILLIYCIKRTQDLSMLTPISSLLHPRKLKNFNMKIFVTQDEESPGTAELLDEALQLEMFTFGTERSHISVGIVQEGLLWRATVAALSFAVFLVSLVLLSNIFVHQVHGKPNRKAYPSWINELLVLTAFIIAMSCSAVATVLFRHQNSRKEHKDIKYSESTKQKSNYETDQKCSSPIRPEMYFKQRPIFSDVLSDISNESTEDENIGVFVCGPDSMKESVASFCKGNPKIDNCKNGSSSSFVFHSVNFSL
ncbi:Ferric reduction oxidase 8 [Rhynchospora pubera]|uniref:Ferric reduction oxidase 8 n=1 Tax=Rhynchospora pubera TaxID=906938 RepID=A0AAV8CDC1_9POAL|nr:Ferric reduction oxidase 8 [Rhynchospora pubera]